MRVSHLLRERGVPVVVDEVLDAGALGGVLSGLKTMRGDGIGVFLAVDLPLVPAPLLAHLVRLAPAFDAIVPVSPRGPEPLCAVYRASCRAALERRIVAGQAIDAPDAARDPVTAELHRGWMHAFGSRALLSVPVTAGDAAVGAVWLEDVPEEAPAAVDFARTRGARALEAYPMLTTPGEDIPWGELHVGSRSIFAAAGFAEIGRPTPRRVVMRIDF